LLAGCATASPNSSQSINVESMPKGADCELSRQGQSLGKLTTPSPITVTRSKDPIQVVCTKAGYEEGRGLLTAEREPPPPFIGGTGLVGGVAGMAYLLNEATRPGVGYKTSIVVLLYRLPNVEGGRGESSAPAREPR
jgi:hypothetical protein